MSRRLASSALVAGAVAIFCGGVGLTVRDFRQHSWRAVLRVETYSGVRGAGVSMPSRLAALENEELLGRAAASA